MQAGLSLKAKDANRKGADDLFGEIIEQTGNAVAADIGSDKTKKIRALEAIRDAANRMIQDEQPHTPPVPPEQLPA